MKEDTAYKTAIEIQALAEKLTPAKQFQIMNTINTLLFCQWVDKEQSTQPSGYSEDKSV